jgi:hypothetical protein
VDRRSFLVAIVAGTALAQTQPEHPESPLAKGLTDVVVARHRAVVDPARTKEIEQGVDAAYQAIDALSKIRVANSEEPAFAFRAVIS